MENALGLKPGFRFIDLFAGIGGFRKALEELGGVCVFSSEIDPTASRSYQVLYGERPAGDIRKVKAESIPDFDVLCGGFPCQAFSVAGKRLGFRDETQGTLFFEIARIAEAKRPKVLFLENVKGLVNHDGGKTLDTIVRVLSDLGYSVDFEVLNSKFFGVPQNRERVFIIGVRDFYTEPYVVSGSSVCAKAKKRINSYGNIRTFNFDWPKEEGVTTRIRDILEDTVDEKYYLSEEKTAKIVQMLNEKETSDIKRIGYIGDKNQGNRVYSVEGVGPAVTSSGGGLGGYGSGVYAVHSSGEDAEFASLREIVDFVLRFGVREIAVAKECAEPFEKLAGFGFFKAKSDGTYALDEEGTETEDGEMRLVGLLDMKGTDQVRRVYDPNGISPTLTTSGGGHREPKIVVKEMEPKVEQISSGEGIACCLDARYYSGISPNIIGKYRRTHIIEQVRAVPIPDRMNKHQKGRRFKDDGEPSFTLTSMDVHGVAIKCSEESKQKAKWRIRKLTPLECFRLQGFPDEFVRRLKEAGVSDTQLYKMAGNAVTVNVILAIGRKLLEFRGSPFAGRDTDVRKTAPSGRVSDKLDAFVSAFATYAKARKLSGKFTSTQLYEDMERFVAETGMELSGIKNAINFGTFLSSCAEKLFERGVEVKKDSKAWVIICREEDTLTEDVSEVPEPLISFTRLMEKFLDEAKPGHYKTSELFLKVKEFATRNGVTCKALSNAIYFGTCLSKEWNLVRGGRYKLSRGKMWRIVEDTENTIDKSAAFMVE